MSALEDIQNYPKDSPEFKAAVVTMRQSNHTHSALEETARVRISHIRHTKGGGETSDSDHVFAELAYERFLKPRPDVASSEYDNLHRGCPRLSYHLPRKKEKSVCKAPGATLSPPSFESHLAFSLLMLSTGFGCLKPTRENSARAYLN
jgi:hypothetical protein